MIENKNIKLNPLLGEWVGELGLVPFDKIKISDFEPSILQAIDEENRIIRKITDNIETPTFENTILPLETEGNALERAVGVLGNLEAALGDENMMELLMKLSPVLSAHSMEVLLNRTLWEKVKYVYENEMDRIDLDHEDRKLIEERYKGFKRNGADLDEDGRERLRQISAELSQLTVQFGQNVANEMKSNDRKIWVKGSDLESFPETDIAAARAEAKAANEAAGKPDDPDTYLFSVYAPSYVPFMKYQRNRDLRKKMHYLYASRNVDGDRSNINILRRIANLRLEMSILLGEKTLADHVLKDTMAGSVEAVESLLNQLREAYMPAMKSEIDELQEFAREEEGADFKLEAWDYSYYFNRLKKARYRVSDEDLKPYFELERTIDGVLSLATKLYGYTFEELKDVPVYHPDVKVYKALDRDGSVLGVLYADFYYREGKSPGAWMTEYRGEYREKYGKRVPPLISIVCNFSKPVGDAPVLLTPGEVNTFLHEFGHALHGLSAATKYSSLSGTNVRRDFVETFSQFNENYLRRKEFLDSFARHYLTGDPIPEDLLSNFLAANCFGAGYACVRQLAFGMLDMAYHTIEKPFDEDADMLEFEKNACEPVKVFEPVSGTSTASAFTHIFSGGYSAGYYGYKWSEVLDADAFEAFEETGNVFSPEVAARFQKMLRSGGTVEPMALYKEFRGREPRIEALMRRDGIIN